MVAIATFNLIYMFKKNKVTVNVIFTVLLLAKFIEYRVTSDLTKPVWFKGQGHRLSALTGFTAVGLSLGGEVKRCW